MVQRVRACVHSCTACGCVRGVVVRVFRPQSSRLSVDGGRVTFRPPASSAVGGRSGRIERGAALNTVVTACAGGGPRFCDRDCPPARSQVAVGRAVARVRGHWAINRGWQSCVLSFIACCVRGVYACDCVLR